MGGAFCNAHFIVILLQPKGLWYCLDGNTNDDVIAMVTELHTSHHDVCYATEVAMVTTISRDYIIYNIQEVNHFTIAHSVSEITYHVNNWAELNKRSKSSDVVKSLLATSNTTLVCNIAEVRIKGWLDIEGGLLLRECLLYWVFYYYSKCQIRVIKCVGKM